MYKKLFYKLFPAKTAPKILIVEDNEDLSNLAELSFSAAGFSVETAKDGMDGIVKTLKFKPEVVLLDLMMPQVNGFEVLTSIRNNASVDTLIVINSSLDDEKDVQRALELGANKYLRKSEFTPAEVVKQVKKFLIEKLPQYESFLKQKEAAPALVSTSSEDNSEKIDLPAEILSRFAIIRTEKTADKITIWLEEKNIEPEIGLKMCGFAETQKNNELNIDGLPCELRLQPRHWQTETDAFCFNIKVVGQSVELVRKQLTLQE